jgi:hypothetical protein
LAALLGSFHSGNLLWLDSAIQHFSFGLLAEGCRSATSSMSDRLFSSKAVTRRPGSGMIAMRRTE